MKNWSKFLGGFLAGVASTILVAMSIAGGSSEASDSGMTFFEQPGECLSTNPFKVLQALGDNYALAYEQQQTPLGPISTSLLVLITNDEGQFYYDDQMIKIPQGKCMQQIGIYRYQTKADDWKTVPIVTLMDK